MKKTIGIVDYGIGNHNSIRQSIKSLGFKSKITNNKEILQQCNLILLPGVGSFSTSINFLKKKKLDNFLIDQAGEGKAILGICLGMQLLGEESHENGINKGLGLIKGVVEKLSKGGMHHIGWNNLVSIKNDNVFKSFDNKEFYFNHTYGFKEIKDQTICLTKFKSISFSSVVRFGKIAGLQFHPEKSQNIGKSLLSEIIKDLCHA